jgi:hypothetical protein
MGVRVSFLSEPAADTGGPKVAGVTVPGAAVQGSGATGAVFVVRGDNVERRAVRLGAGGKDEVTVLSGLTAGERVVVGDLDKLKDGTKIRVEP